MIHVEIFFVQNGVEMKEKWMLKVAYPT